ncbi:MULTISPECIES: response regulator [Salegentibacter]|jgi:two-component system KDP operon response regulator KdpE|uniref:Two-component system, OmpR family, KDP operon response regulator KdpE n=1 Tax=Salegentibacter agarivorans TaxID=345907 RepID=A0A1I2N940_9FLAO|nr:MULTISPECIES: response regulator transcription factor [Salegentibacter]APS39679.1 two-component system response regulator [Salegentibacter sp. T436]SFG00008.1 two-component system, OmpR family, KDP operon response regulator KdpE [Salegentibacter agarivorans]|tara:strand:- start:34 stop:711 length:678 start_codon:yes stop_codon:yes gene_type:complete
MNNAEILVIDDEPQIRKLLKITLESNDYKVVLAETGTEGVHLVANHTPNLVILDLGLPDKSGHLILKDLREWYDKSIIILSVQDSEADIIKALDNGATDYLTKPFRTGELLARIRASLRINQNTDLQPIISTGELEIDLSSRTVSRNNIPVKLTATEYNLVALLAKNQGRVLTHQFLLKEIWGFGSQNETQYLRVFIAQLRKKLEENPNSPVHIITESGVGYRFV